MTTRTMGWTRFSPIAAIGMIALALLTYTIAFDLPVYTDELGWKLMSARTFLDGGTTLNLSATCGNLGIAVPALLLPLRWLDGVVYGHLASPVALRWSGVATGFFGVGATIVLLRRLRPTLSISAIVLAVIAMCTIGVMPFLIEVNRPEQILAIAAILLSLPLIFEWRPAGRSLGADVLWGIALFVCCSFVLAAHPRGLFLLPLMIMFAIRAIDRVPVAAVVSAALVAMTLVILHNWTERTACNDPALNDLFIHDNITFAASQGALVDYLKSLLSAWRQAPLRALFIDQFQFRTEYTSSMFPPALGRLSTVMRWTTRLAALGLLGTGLIAFLLVLFRPSQWRLRGLAILAVGALWAFWATSAVARVHKVDYEATAMMPVFVIASIGSVWLARDIISRWIGVPRWRQACLASLCALVVLSVASQAVFITNYRPWTKQAWLTPGYAQEQRYSVSLVGYDKLAPEIQKTGEMCGLDPKDPPAHLVLDELTYYEYQRSYQPIIATYIDKASGWGIGIHDYRQFLSKIGSHGMVAGCQWIPAELQASAKQNGRFCCVPSFAGSQN